MTSRRSAATPLLPPGAETLRFELKAPAAETTMKKIATRNKTKKRKLPPGWTEKRIRELAAFHDNLTEDEEAAEIEAALSKKDHTVMVVPTVLVPEIVKLIARKQTARAAVEP
jgi:hypothetical protein